MPPEDDSTSSTVNNSTVPKLTGFGYTASVPPLAGYLTMRSSCLFETGSKHPAVFVWRLGKRFGDWVASGDVSFEIGYGDVFG